MLAETELIIQPYSSKVGKSILEILIKEFRSGKWTRFQAAVAFVRQSGNFSKLLEAIQAFVAEGGEVEITFGANTFGGDAQGSDYEALEVLLSKFEGESGVRLHLYHEKDRTFHPKLYLFSNQEGGSALLIVGSSNWSGGGFLSNVEVNVLLKLELTKEDHWRYYQVINDCFKTYWTEVE